MFNNVLLDVFIGLVLVYLLYSLFVTIVSELVVTWMALRSRILRVSVEKMLNDGYFNNVKDPKYHGVSFIVQRFFLKEFPDFKHSFAGKFYAQPSIKYMANRAGEQRTFFTQTKPSYLTDENFAVSLIQLLKDKATGATDMEKVHFCLSFNTHYIQPGTLKHLRDMAESAGDDLDAFKNKIKGWYNETQDRANGWYKRKLQVILFWMGFVVAVAFNVDTIQIAKILSKDKDAREQLVRMGIELSKDSARYAEFITNADSTHSKAILDSGYARITRDINEASLVLGLGWGTAGKVKPLTCVIDSVDDRSAFAGLKGEIADFNNLQSDFDIYSKSKESNADSIRFLVKRTRLLGIDTLRFIQQEEIRKRLQDSLKILQRFLAQYTSDSLFLQATGKELTAIKSIANAATGNAFVFIDSMYRRSDNKIIVKGQRAYTWYEKVGYVFKSMFNWQSIIGFCITGLMISLGAPFWFDLLKKLVSIRGSGVKPEEKAQKTAPPTSGSTTAAGKTAPAQQVAAIPGPVGDIADEALRVYAPQLRKIPGVRSVFKVTDPATKQKIIQVNVVNNAVINEVAIKFPVLRIGGIIVKHKVVVSGVPVTHAGNEGIISNSSGKNGFGTLGCQLQRTETGSMHILSCWHVLKGDTKYSEKDEHRNIRHQSGNDFAVRWAGNIQGAFDYGIARCNDTHTGNFNDFLREKLKIKGPITTRPLSRTDIDNQVTVKYFDCLNGAVREGFILTDCDEVDIDYLDKTRTIKDVLVLTNEEEKTISRPGNSGSIIFDQNNFAIGMIISGDLHHTYAIKLSHIFSIHTEMKIA